MAFVYIIINAIAYVLTFCLYQRQKKSIDVGSLFYFIFAVASIGSVWYYSQDNVDRYYSDISPVAFIYLWLMINICLHPLAKCRFEKLKGIDDTGLEYILHYMSVAFVVLTIMPFLSLLGRFSFSAFSGNALGMMYESEGDKAAMFFSGISKICFALIRRFEDLIAILLFYQLTRPRKKWILVGGLTCSVMLFLMFKLMSGSRGAVMSTFILLMSLTLLFKNVLSAEIYRKIKLVGLVFVVVMAVFVAYISISRFSYSVSVAHSEATMERWISQYLGEGMVRFNDQIWNLREQMFGSQNFVVLKNFLGLEPISNYDTLMRVYEVRLRLPINVFYTFIGDFFIDFGVLLTVPLVFLFRYLFSKALYITKGGTVTIPQLMILAVFFHLLGFGWAANVYRTPFIQQDTFFSLILMFILYMIQKTSKISTPPPKS